jgi:hypothetical protein
MSDQLKHWIDAISVTTVLATLTAWLPPLAALASLLWSLVRLWETKTVQKLFGRGRAL